MKFPNRHQRKPSDLERLSSYIDDICLDIETDPDFDKNYIRAAAFGIIKKIATVLDENPAILDHREARMLLDKDLEITPENLLRLAFTFGDLFYYKTGNMASATRLINIWNKENPGARLDPEQAAYLKDFQKPIFERCFPELLKSNGVEIQTRQPEEPQAKRARIETKATAEAETKPNKPSGEPERPYADLLQRFRNQLDGAGQTS